MTQIYGLVDPETGLIRYVGRSVNPRKRLLSHVKDARKNIDKANKGRWIRGLLGRGHRPFVVTLETCVAGEWEQREVWWVRAMRSQGVVLVNSCDGGGGIAGYRHTPERIEKYASKLRGVPKSQEHRRRLSEAKRGLKWSDRMRSAVMSTRTKNPTCMARVVVGNRNPRAIVTESDVREIRRLYGEGMIQREIGKIFGLTQMAVSKIVLRHNWSHVE